MTTGFKMQKMTGVLSIDESDTRAAENVGLRGVEGDAEFGLGHISLF